LAPVLLRYQKNIEKLFGRLVKTVRRWANLWMRCSRSFLRFDWIGIIKLFKTKGFPWDEGFFLPTTVDGRNPAPPGMYKTL